MIRQERAALANGDADGAYAAAYDAYRMAGEALLARQLLRATGGDGSHVAVEDAISGALVDGNSKRSSRRVAAVAMAGAYIGFASRGRHSR